MIYDSVLKFPNIKVSDRGKNYSQKSKKNKSFKPRSLRKQTKPWVISDGFMELNF